jgi:hypothetical protein
MPCSSMYVLQKLAPVGSRDYCEIDFGIPVHLRVPKIAIWPKQSLVQVRTACIGSKQRRLLIVFCLSIQGCQMVYLQTKNNIFDILWKPSEWKMFIYFWSIWSIIWPLSIFYGIFYGLLVYFYGHCGILRHGYVVPRKIGQLCFYV